MKGIVTLILSTAVALPLAAGEIHGKVVCKGCKESSINLDPGDADRPLFQPVISSVLLLAGLAPEPKGTSTFCGRFFLTDYSLFLYI